jgi:hypothetical protein
MVRVDHSSSAAREAVGDRDRAAGGEVGFAVGGVFAADPGVADPDALD